MIRKVGILWMLLSLLGVCGSYAEDIKEIHWATEQWERATMEDGGLYHDIMHGIYDPLGVKVVLHYVPIRRAMEMVKQGQADITGGFQWDEETYYQAKHPMLESRLAVLFRTDRIKNWEGIETLHEKIIVGPPQYAPYLPDENLREVNTRASGIGMLKKGRADFYFDDMTYLEENEERLNINTEDYRIEVILVPQYFMVFGFRDKPFSERAKTLLEMYEAGIERMYKDGTLHPIYEKWGFSLPTFEKVNTDETIQ